MKFASVILSYVLLTSYVSAAPPRSRSTLEERIVRRTGRRSTQPVEYTEASIAAGNETNWSGVVITSPPSGQTFDGVTASFVVPTSKVPTGSSSGGSYSASAWVGIDGDTYQNAILQTRVDFTISNGKVSYDA
jgi:hypothetical protein